MQTVISNAAETAFDLAQMGAQSDKVVQSDRFNLAFQAAKHSDVVDWLDMLSAICHEAAASRGWWHIQTGTQQNASDGEIYSAKSAGRPINWKTEPVYALKERNVGEMIALMHSELSEALEAARKGVGSDHITEFSGLEEELADCLIRIFDFAGAAQLRLGEAFVAKMKFNAEREDHKMSERMKEGGKKI